MYYHNKTPHNFTFKKEVTLFSGEHIDIFFEVSKDSRITSFFYFSAKKVKSGILKQFSYLAQLVEEIKCEDMLTFSWMDIVEQSEDEQLEQMYDDGDLPLVCEPLFHVQKALSEFIGVSKVSEYRSDKDETICFCFAVTKSEINSFLDSNPTAKMLDLTNALNVAGACQSCLSQVKEILYRSKMDGMDYSKVSLDTIELALSEWDEIRTYVEMGLIEVDHLEQEKLFFKVQNPEKFNDLTWKVEDYLLEKIGYSFEVSFLHFS